MERKKYIYTILITTLNMTILSQNNHVIYNAFVTGDMRSWKHVIDSMETISNKSLNVLEELINYEYGYIGWCIGNQKNQEAESYLNKCYKNIELAKNLKFEESQYYAYKAALIGFEVGISYYKAPFIGLKSLEYSKKSVELNNQNSFAYLQLGNVYFHMPAVFGGSKLQALSYYLKSLSLYEMNLKNNEKNWNYLSVIVNIIETYYELGKYEDAKKYCLKALSIEPQFNWVKNNLYVKVLNKLKI